jgi:hypothetical protein
MRKLVIATAIVAASMTAMAADKLDMTIINTGAKAGGFFAESMGANLDLTKTGKYNINYINPGNVCAAVSMINAADKKTPIMFPWDSTLDAGSRAQNSCSLKVDASEIIRVNLDVYQVCSSKPEMTVEKFTQSGSSWKIGHIIPANLWPRVIGEGLNPTFHSNNKPVFFAVGSSGTIAALANGEIDYGIIESKMARKFVRSGAGKCFARLGIEKHADGMVPIAAADPANKNLRVGYYIIFAVKNATPEQLAQIKKDFKVAQDDETSETAKIWAGSGIKFDWSTKTNAEFGPQWEESVQSFIQK